MRVLEFLQAYLRDYLFKRFSMKEFRQSELDLKWLVFVFKQHTKVHINRVFAFTVSD